jgi:type VI secretion system protein ImpF
MPKADNDYKITQCLIDRLMEADPKMTPERQLKAALRRDLESLLNTRRVVEPPPEALTEVTRSLYNYGLPDFSSYSLSSPKDRGRLLRALEVSISLFEPRLAGVKVTAVEAPSAGSRVLRFQIEGLLLKDPAPEQVSFDTVLQLANGEYQVKGERGAG